MIKTVVNYIFRDLTNSQPYIYIYIYIALFVMTASKRMWIGNNNI